MNKCCFSTRRESTSSGQIKEEQWERYFCEMCNFNAGKEAEVERHKENVHAKQQQSDFATYVTRTLLRQLVMLFVALACH